MAATDQVIAQRVEAFIAEKGLGEQEFTDAVGLVNITFYRMFMDAPNKFPRYIENVAAYMGMTVEELTAE